jgi:hypothetical protein
MDMTTIEFLVKIPWELILLLSLIMVGYGFVHYNLPLVVIGGVLVLISVIGTLKHQWDYICKVDD